MTLSLPMRTEFDRLVYDHSQEFAELVLSGQLEGYLWGTAKAEYSVTANIAKQLEGRCTPSMADIIAREIARG